MKNYNWPAFLARGAIVFGLMMICKSNDFWSNFLGIILFGNGLDFLYGKGH